MTDNREYIVSTFRDGDTLVEYEHTELVGTGPIYLSVTMPVLQKIEKILEIHVTNESPRTLAYGPTHVTVSGNVVGFTLAVVTAATTLSVNVCAVGF